jgi:integrase
VQRVRTFKGSEREGSKTNVVRDVDLVPQALAALQIMERYTRDKKQEDGRPMDIFQNPLTGKAWHDERSQRDTYWRPALTRLGIRWRTPYCCRHTAASVALMAGVPAPYIAKQLGHSIKILLEVYADWIPDNDQGRAKSLLKAAMLVVSNDVDEKNPPSSERIYPTSIPPNLHIAVTA